MTKGSECLAEAELLNLGNMLVRAPECLCNLP